MSMNLLKKIFYVLLVADGIELILSGVSLASIFTGMAEYGQVMMIVSGVLTAVAVAVMVFEILAKVTLIRSTAPTFSWESGRKGCVRMAKLLLLINLAAVIINLLATGGEGATVINQGRMYLKVLASAVEAVTVFVYLRKVKKLGAAKA